MPFDTRPSPDLPQPIIAPPVQSAIQVGRTALPPFLALLAALALGAVLGALPAAGPSGADPDLARLMKAMAVLKAGMAAGLVALIGWRFTLPAGAARVAPYLAAAGAMAAGVVLMWRMAALGPAAIALHAGLFGAIFLLLRDRAIIARIEAAIARRRALGEAGAAYADDDR